MKTEVYSWRISLRRKSDLEAEASRQGASLAGLLEQITGDWLQARRGARNGEETEQKRLRDLAAKAFGAISGGQPLRSQHARQAVRQRLRKRHAARRSR